MPRFVFLILGFFFTGLGLVGAFVPLLPTVPFLLLALWCFARSSQRFHDWLYNHPRWGPPLRQWNRHGVIPLKAKIASCSMMTLSMGIMLWTTDLHPLGYIGIGSFLLCVGIWIATRPGRVPAVAEEQASPPQ